jgi:hypothetical protein
MKIFTLMVMRQASSIQRQKSSIGASLLGPERNDEKEASNRGLFALAISWMSGNGHHLTGCK